MTFPELVALPATQPAWTLQHCCSAASSHVPERAAGNGMGRPEFAAVHKHLEADALAHRQRPEVDLFEDDPLAHGPQGVPWGLQAQWERGEKLKKICEEEQKVRSAHLRSNS